MSQKEHPIYEIAQYIADHEPAIALYRDVRFHLAGCESCRDLAQKLRVTEAALETYPQVNANYSLRPHLVEIIRQNQSQPPEWKLMPWTIWVPTTALVVATLATLILAPGGANTLLPINLQGPVITLPQNIGSGLPHIQVLLNNQTVLTIGSAVAAILSGAGLVWALSSLSPEQDKKLQDIGNQVTENAAQFLRPKHT
ncbi:MAG: hypothetical protein ACYC6L_17665 [Anaerolineae bacterium]